MPRQNRYHPYANSNRQSSVSHAAPQLSSPRYPHLPNLSIPHLQAPPPSVSTIPEFEQPINTNPSSYQPTQPFQPIFPAYIRGTTTDGKPLLTKSIFQGPDGTFHIQMQAVRYPSECVAYTAHGPLTVNNDYAGIGDMYERWVANGPGPTYINSVTETKSRRANTPLSQDSGMGSVSGSDDGKSVNEEDAVGENEGAYEELTIVMRGSDAGCCDNSSLVVGKEAYDGVWR